MKSLHFEVLLVLFHNLVLQFLQLCSRISTALSIDVAMMPPLTVENLFNVSPTDTLMLFIPISFYLKCQGRRLLNQLVHFAGLSGTNREVECRGLTVATTNQRTNAVLNLNEYQLNED